jgi:hypothetical protein
LNVGKLNSLPFKKPATSNFNSRAQTHQAFLVPHTTISGAYARGSPIVAASRLPSFQSQTRNGTVAGRFSILLKKANSVSPLPARIALQGGKRAGADAICPCPPQDESNFGNLHGRSTSPGLGFDLSNFSRTGFPLRIQR